MQKPNPADSFFAFIGILLYGFVILIAAIWIGIPFSLLYGDLGFGPAISRGTLWGLFIIGALVGIRLLMLRSSIAIQRVLQNPKPETEESEDEI